VVQAVPEADGRWCAQIVPIRSAWEDKAYRWQVDEAGVRALLRSPVRRKPGPKPTGDWPMEVARWLIMVARKHPDALENISQLVRDAREFLQKQGLFAPQEDKDLRRVIQRLLEL
jgi:hypothetical protein